MRRYWKTMAILAAVIGMAVIGWLFWFDVSVWLEQLFFPRLRPAVVDATPVPILVGENVHVSKPHEKMAFTECIIAADPNRANRLFASSLYWPHGHSTSLVGYLSDDGGTTWTTSLELVSDRAKEERLADETAVFGPNGDLYLVHIRMVGAKAGTKPFGEELDWRCLPAGAATWETRGCIDRRIDRPWLTVDHTNGPNRGRLYCTGNIGTPYAPCLIISPDGSRTFDFPSVPNASKWSPYPAPPVVLSDGSLLAAFRCTRDGQFVWQPEYFPTFRSTDGGQSLTAEAFVSNWKHPRLTPNIVTTQGPSFPQLAVDPGSPRFADNLYIVWAQRFDNRRTTEWILFSRSTDRGKSWSAPVNLSEQPDTDDDYLAYIPCIAVNNAGVVAVTWYDRRGLPPERGGEATRGWNLRVRVSVDGGATWAPSVQVTSQASRGELTGWHTAGLCADAAGNFHPAWIDDRTGKPQLWTTRVTVE